MELLAGIFYVGLVIYLANDVNTKPDEQKTLIHRSMLYGLVVLLGFLGVNILLLSQIPAEAVPEDLRLDPVLAPLLAIFIIGMALFAGAAVRSVEVRYKLAEVLARLGGAAYQPLSKVHTTAIVVVSLLLAWTLSAFILVGGLEGLAESLETAPSITELGFFALIYVLGSFLGAGLFLRRTPAESFGRLGLRLPTQQDVLWGFGTGILLFGLILVGGLIWTTLSSPELVDEQTIASEQIFETYSVTLLAGLLLAATSAIGEEVLFRGALQPIFGLAATSVIFMLMHPQYFFTPAMLLIFGVGLGLGWLRQRYSTTAAMIAHFIYNLIPFLLASSGLA